MTTNNNNAIPTKFTVYPMNPDGTPGEIIKKVIDLPKEPNYQQLKGILEEWFGREWFEHVFIDVKSGNPKSMFVDESGMIKSLPLNRVVSAKDEFYPGNIFGIAVVCDRRVWY